MRTKSTKWSLFGLLVSDKEETFFNIVFTQVDSHRNLILQMQQWANDDASLLAVTNEVDYDQDGKNIQKYLKQTDTKT
jgi:hypothetical protein